MSPIDPRALAHLDTRRLCLVFQEIGGEIAPLAGGWMACDIPGSWARYAVGIGLDSLPSSAELDTLEDYYVDRGCPPTIQLSDHHHPDMPALLSDRGFAITDREVVLGRRLDGELPRASPVDGLVLREVDPHDDEDVEAFVRAQIIGFDAPEGLIPITRRVGRGARWTVLLAELHGEIIGSCGIEPYETLSVLIAGAVFPQARRRGVQSQMITTRLHLARAQGAEIVTVGSVLGGPTARNAARFGFAPLYELTEWTKPLP